jgi:hypothetical protein
MKEIITSSDFSIDIDDFWITEKEIKNTIEKEIEEWNIKEEEKNETSIKNRIIIWLIIWKIGEKFSNLHMSLVDFNNEEINNIIETLSLALEINKDFHSFEEIWNHIFKHFNFNDIKSYFLSNKVQVDLFLEKSKFFLKYHFDTTSTKTNKIINSIEEL